MNKTVDLLTESLRNEAIQLLQQSWIKIEHCLGQLDDQQIWLRPFPASNSIANQLLHLEGNLKQWTLCGVGGENDDRNRESEFSRNGGLAKLEIEQQVKQVVQRAIELIQRIPTEQWLTELTIQGFQVNTHGAISHTTSHFVGHTHQIIQLTRWILGDLYKFQWQPDSDRSQVPI